MHKITRKIRFRDGRAYLMQFDELDNYTELVKLYGRKRALRTINRAFLIQQMYVKRQEKRQETG